jgi:hypothetical protein
VEPDRPQDDEHHDPDGRVEAVQPRIADKEQFVPGPPGGPASARMSSATK